MLNCCIVPKWEPLGLNNLPQLLNLSLCVQLWAREKAMYVTLHADIQNELEYTRRGCIQSGTVNWVPSSSKIMDNLYICWNIIGSQVQEMISGLIQNLSSPRRGNETFQLRRMARLFWVRRQLVRRGKKYISYFILDGMLVFFFPCGQKGFI